MRLVRSIYASGNKTRQRACCPRLHSGGTAIISTVNLVKIASHEPLSAIARFHLHRTVSTGVSFLWDGDSFLQVRVPPSYKGKMCGLCGNFNGNKTDDFTTKRGHQVKLTRRFARSWLVGGEEKRDAAAVEAR